jgi:uncharacterized membrane protein YhaH (DUF805 family)
MDWGDLLFGYKGRINRAKYWLAALIYIAAVVAAALIGYALGWGAMLVLMVLVGIGCFVSGVFVAIKRLHDRDKSGWWLLLFYGVPVVLDGIARLPVAEGSYVLPILSFGISIWALVELGFLRGTVGPNQYGLDPLAPSGPPGVPMR